MTLYRDFPGGPVVKNLPSNAGDVGSNLGRGTEIPHALGQLSPCATTRETCAAMDIQHSQKKKVSK